MNLSNWGRRLLRSVGGVPGVLLVGILIGADDPPKEPPDGFKTIEFRAGLATLHRSPPRSLFTYLTTETDTSGKRILQPRVAARRSVIYPALTKGSLFPLDGYLYRVTVAEKRKHPDGKGDIDVLVAEWVKDADLLEAVKFRSGAIGLPLRDTTGGSGMVYIGEASGSGTTWKVEEIRLPARPAEPPVARVSTTHGTKDRKGVPDNRIQGTAEVRSGDVLSDGETGYLVRAVVPADAKTGVIGWVELDPTPITGEKLREDKRVVYPKPEKK